MSDFLGFGQIIRPDIGLSTDQSLAEIFTSDQEDALRNIRLNPEILDTIFGLSDSLDREDLRTVSGLSSLLLPTLDLQDEVFERVNESLFVDQDYINSTNTIGIDPDNPSLKGDSVSVDNVIIYNGSIQCETVQYRTKTLGENSLYSGAINKLTSVSSSRASLFNAVQYSDVEPNTGYFKSASLSSSVRVRRRSHVNKIVLNKSSFIPKSPVTENPSHEIVCFVDNGNTGSASEVRLLATKNTPLKIPCRIGSGGKIIFRYNSPGKFFFGFQVQPTQSKTLGEAPQFLPLDPKPQLVDATFYELDIDITSTGYQNAYDLYLYLYVNPEAIRDIEFSGINITEFIDGKDIGLVGFSNLQLLKLSNTSIKIPPIWLKTLSTKLRTLDLYDDGDTYRSSQFSYFDYRDSSETPNLKTPFYTVVSYLTLPKKGTMINEDGDDWNDGLSGEGAGNHVFKKYILSEADGTTYSDSRVSSTDGSPYDFRVFSALRTLNIGDLFYGKNPRFDDVFPGLTSLTWIGERGAGGVPTWTSFNSRPDDARIFGPPPKLNNHGNPIIGYNISRSGCNGTISDIGTSSTVTDNTINGSSHISKYIIKSLNISGAWPHRIGVSGGIATSNASEWSTWFDQTTSINISWSNIYINLQDFTWNQLSSLSLNHSGGVTFNNPVSAAIADPLLIPKVRSLNLYGSFTTGYIPSLGTDPGNHTNSLTFLGLGSGTVNWSTYDEGGVSFVLPSNFAPDRPSSPHKLTELNFNDSDIVGSFRQDDLQYLYELSTLTFTNADGLYGKFPIIPSKQKPSEESKDIYIYIQEGCKFYDLSSCNINPGNLYIARDIIELVGWGGLNASNGGCKSPSFEGVGGANATRIGRVDLGNSLTSKYPSSWYSGKGGKYISDDDDPSIVALVPGRIEF
jgi:hypothetical protein